MLSCFAVLCIRHRKTIDLCFSEFQTKHLVISLILNKASSRYNHNEFLTLGSSITQARNQLGTPGRQRAFWEWPKFFILCPIH